ncbi:hypothetical protein Lalb_Chr19g0129431 [Lupinus albus]|uniref:Uncharacterized protein n=1 Tax=Lupinus albus TaxID=3870 RepID=A0A6A4NSR3_LUPAL|nr:hypothetical protein Lalb_Chr19g0129431 [Lupinus albus]
MSLNNKPRNSPNRIDDKVCNSSHKRRMDGDRDVNSKESKQDYKNSPLLCMFGFA